MLDILWSLGFFILAIGTLVAVHEWGHFYVARKCGVKVQRFSIGFGKALWRTHDKKGTEYVIAAIPLGGYVKMLDERAEQVNEADLPYAFNRQSVAKRMAIIAAGPAVNFIFAIFALAVMFMVGMTSVKPFIGDVTQGSIADAAGLQPGDQIVAVEGAKTPTWEAARLELTRHIGDASITLQVIPEDHSRSVERTMDTTGWQFDPEKQSPFTTLGFAPYRPPVTGNIAQVAEDSPAQRAGIQPGDKIVGVDGTWQDDWGQIQGYLADRPGENVTLLLERGNQALSVDVQLDSVGEPDQQRGFLGVVATQQPWPESMLLEQQYWPWEAVALGSAETWRFVRFTFSAIGKLFTGDISVKNLSGPVSIAQGAGVSADYGVAYFLRFLAIISVSLGIINLLPIPVLDGGHLMFYAFEWLTGKPVSERVQEIGYRIGAALLFVMMTVAIFNDFGRL